MRYTTKKTKNTLTNVNFWYIYIYNTLRVYIYIGLSLQFKEGKFMKRRKVHEKNFKKDN